MVELTLNLHIINRLWWRWRLVGFDALHLLMWSIQVFFIFRYFHLSLARSLWNWCVVDSFLSFALCVCTVMRLLAFLDACVFSVSGIKLKASAPVYANVLRIKAFKEWPQYQQVDICIKYVCVGVCVSA